MRQLNDFGWYIDALPTGEVVYLVPGQWLQTHRGKVALPDGQNVLYLDLDPASGTRFCGVGHAGSVEDIAMEWTGSTWKPHGKTVGPRSVIFDAAGVVRTVPTTGHPAGSQGYRQVGDDGQLVLGDSTYVHNGWKIHEYTRRGNLVVGTTGKGPHGEDGVLVLTLDAQDRVIDRRVLAEGQCRFTKFRRAGDDLAIVWVDERLRQSCARWLTVAELQAFPTQRFDTPPIPQPVPTPIPEPPPVPEEPAPLLDDVTRVWNKYAALRGGTPTHDDRGPMLNEVAWQHRALGWGLSKKAGGANVRQPRTNIPIAHDVLQFGPTDATGQAVMYDVFTDSGPVWVKANPHNDPDRTWVAPVEPEGGGTDTDTDTDTDGPPPSGSFDALFAAKIAAALKPLQDKCLDLEARADDQQKEIDALERRVSELTGGGGGITFPKAVSIRSRRNGKLLCNDQNKPKGQRVQADDRDNVGEWETWDLEEA